MSATMVMKWATAASTQANSEAAIGEALTEVKNKLAGAQPDAAFLFVTPHHRARYQHLGAAVMNTLSPRTLLGCSGGGVIAAGQEIEQTPGISLCAAALPGVEITPFHLSDADLPDSDSSPRRWQDAIGVKAEDGLSFILVADPFSIHVDALIEGLDFAYPSSVKVGGLASGANAPGQNALYLNQRYYRDGAVGLALSGDICVDTLVAQGCRPIGAPMKITKCNRNILLEVDRRAIFDVLNELYHLSDERDQTLIRSSLFLGLLMDPFKDGRPQPGDFLIRNLMGMDQERGVLAINAELTEGQSVQFHVRDADAARQDLAAVLRRYSTDRMNAAGGESLPGSPRGALLFSCLGRGARLYNEADYDSKTFIKEVGETPLGGFFCGGEIGPVGGMTHIHGFTSCFGVFRPKKA